jgi:hypothetical protein
MSVTLVGAAQHHEPPPSVTTGVRKIFGAQLRSGDERAQAADVLLEDEEDVDADPVDEPAELLPASELLLSDELLLLAAGLLLEDEPRLSVR